VNIGSQENLTTADLTNAQSWVLANGNASADDDQAVSDLRLPRGSVADELFRRPWKFDFFQVVSLLQGLAKRDVRGPSASVGEFAQPTEESVRFTVPHSTAFPTATVPTIKWDQDERRASVEVNFAGLTGPSGILPEPYNDRLRDIARAPRHRERNALRDWLDRFNHRLISLFYGAWAKYRFPVSVRSDQPADIRTALTSIAGLDRSVTQEPAEPQTRPRIDRDEWLGMAGLLSQRPMNVTNLTAALEACLGVKVNVVEFQGSWLELEDETRLQLGVDHHQLGRNAVIGDRIWSRQQRILIEVGPLAPKEFARFLPPSESHVADGYLRLRELMERFVGPTLQFDIRPRLSIDGPIECKLADEPIGNRLGIDSWLGTPAEGAVASDAIFAGRT
jgi:type VI secretion system protein ImpH